MELFSFLVLRLGWEHAVLDSRFPTGSFPSPYHFHSSQAEETGKSNILLHGCGTNSVTVHGLVVLNCIRENHAMYILHPQSNTWSVMYILA